MGRARAAGKGGAGGRVAQRVKNWQKPPLFLTGAKLLAVVVNHAQEQKLFGQLVANACATG